VRPIIAISRQHGARGAAVGKLVAERLGYTLWDRELVAAIAAQVDADPAHIAALDERCHEPGARGPTASTPEHAGHADYLRGLEQVARAIARRGAAVVVGRGIGFLVDHDDCLRTRVVCPLNKRVVGLAERSKLSLETARATIDYVDSCRRAFMRERHGVDVEDPTTFDVVVSTASMSLEAVASVIVTAYNTRFDLRRWPRSTIGPPAHEHHALADDRR
jgi:cytidylate kinase